MMSIISKLVNTTPTNQNQLTREELEFLLYVLKSTNIVGEQVEMFYNLVLKLQNQYVEQTKK